MYENKIRQLAARKPTKAPVVSLYIDTVRNDESQRDRIRLFLKNELNKLRDVLGGSSQADAAIEKTIHAIETEVANSLAPETRGMAIFTSPQESFFETVQLPVPVRPEVTIGSRPHLRQLMELRYRYPRVVVAMVDAKSGRLFMLEFGKILTEFDLENPDLPRRHDQGGWSQANMQRHVRDHIDRHEKEVAEALARIVDRQRIETVILSGQERNRANFRSFLPKRVEEKIIGTLQLDIKSSPEEVVAACRHIVDERRSKSSADRVGALRNNGRTALGLAAVLDAANQKRLENLYISSNAQMRGWRCANCAMLGVQMPLGCPSCGSEVHTVDVIDELISAAELEDASVECVSEVTVLDQHEGVGATLRF
jgi:peptide subunit release factor 1 (eRF1)